METFGENRTVAHWTEYLQNFLNNRLVCGELRCIENWVETIRANIHFASPSEIRGGLRASWHLWTKFLEEFYPELFFFLRKRNFFIAGTNFISAIVRIRNPTVAKFHRLSHKYQIVNTVGILHTVIKATVILLSENRSQFQWLHSKFRSNVAIKNFSLNLLHIIDPQSPILRRNFVSTE